MLRVSALRTAFLKGQAFAFLQCGMSLPDVARKLSVPRQTIRSWQVNNFRIERRPVSGRPRTCSRRRDRRIVSLSRSDPRLSVREIAAVTGCSFGTVLRRLKEAGLVSRRRTGTLELTERHKRVRLQWSMRHCHWRTAQWRRIVFTDEASVRLRSSDGRLRIWIRSGNDVPESYLIPHIQSGGGSLLIWGAIWIGGRSDLHIQSVTMNSER